MCDSAVGEAMEAVVVYDHLEWNKSSAPVILTSESRGAVTVSGFFILCFQAPFVLLPEFRDMYMLEPGSDSERVCVESVMEEATRQLEDLARRQIEGGRKERRKEGLQAHVRTYVRPVSKALTRKELPKPLILKAGSTGPPDAAAENTKTFSGLRLWWIAAMLRPSASLQL